MQVLQNGKCEAEGQNQTMGGETGYQIIQSYPWWSWMGRPGLQEYLSQVETNQSREWWTAKMIGSIVETTSSMLFLARTGKQHPESNPCPRTHNELLLIVAGILAVTN